MLFVHRSSVFRPGHFAGFVVVRVRADDKGLFVFFEYARGGLGGDGGQSGGGGGVGWRGCGGGGAAEGPFHLFAERHCGSTGGAGRICVVTMCEGG